MSDTREDKNKTITAVIGGCSLKDHPSIFVESQIRKTKKGIAYFKLSNIIKDKVKLNKAALGMAEKITNIDIKSLSSPEISINITKANNTKTKKQENYIMTKTDSFKNSLN